MVCLQASSNTIFHHTNSFQPEFLSYHMPAMLDMISLCLQCYRWEMLEKWLSPDLALPNEHPLRTIQWKWRLYWRIIFLWRIDCRDIKKKLLNSFWEHDKNVKFGPFWSLISGLESNSRPSSSTHDVKGLKWHLHAKLAEELLNTFWENCENVKFWPFWGFGALISGL